MIAVPFASVSLPELEKSRVGDAAPCTMAAVRLAAESCAERLAVMFAPKATSPARLGFAEGVESGIDRDESASLKFDTLAQRSVFVTGAAGAVGAVTGEASGAVGDAAGATAVEEAAAERDDELVVFTELSLGAASTGTGTNVNSGATSATFFLCLRSGATWG